MLSALESSEYRVNVSFRMSLQQYSNFLIRIPDTRPLRRDLESSIRGENNPMFGA